MSMYVNTARFDTGRALTEDELRVHAPSIFAVDAHSSRSERFAPIPTIEIVRGLAREGFAVVGARQAVCRQEGRRDYTKHLLRIRQLDATKVHSVGDSVFEMLMKNANDGTCKYNLMGALFRILCLNSMVAQDKTLDEVTVRHSGKVMDKVIEGTYSVMKSAERVLAAPQDWSRIELKQDERLALAEGAHTLRFADSEGNVKTPIKPEALLEARRTEDHKPDLWTTFNVIQENVIKGGLHGLGTDANNNVRRVTTRKINGIDQDVKLNKALWVLAERMKELKTAA